jgi:hypothetical protein
MHTIIIASCFVLFSWFLTELVKLGATDVEFIIGKMIVLAFGGIAALILATKKQA